MNSKEIQNKIKEVQEEMNNDVMIKLKKKNEEEYIEKMKSIFADFSENYPGIFDKILDNSINDEQFKKMLNLLNEMEEGQLSEHEASVKVGESLVNKYVKPVLPEGK